MRTRLSICRRKASYASVEDACHAAANFRLELRTYRCDRCRSIHLTSRTKGKRVPRPAPLPQAINEPAAQGAAHALKSAGKTGVTIVAIDGGCSNLPFVAAGEIGATAGQFPGKMAVEGVDAIAKFAKTGEKPTNQAGQDFFNTGTQLYTDSAQTGVSSITTKAAASLCWGQS